MQISSLLQRRLADSTTNVFLSFALRLCLKVGQKLCKVQLLQDQVLERKQPKSPHNANSLTCVYEIASHSYVCAIAEFV